MSSKEREVEAFYLKCAALSKIQRQDHPLIKAVRALGAILLSIARNEVRYVATIFLGFQIVRGFAWASYFEASTLLHIYTCAALRLYSSRHR